MNTFSDLSDDEFVPFLNSLGVETYKKSFEWMFNDPEFAGVLRWLYSNLDNSNALNPREEYRYAEIQKKGTLMPQEELESTISSIQDEYLGIPLPGDQDALEDMKLDTVMLKERLGFLEKQEEVIEDLIMQNELVKDDLNCKVANLNSMQSQSKEDEGAASEECLGLAQEVESITDSVVDVVAETLDLYSRCHLDKETAKKFLAFGPFESYKQSQALFRSHFDLYTTKKFDKKRNENGEVELQTPLIEAKGMEKRLAVATSKYISSKAELSGEKATLALIANHEDILNMHASQIPIASMEAHSAIELLEQEEAILHQQLETTVKSYVQGLTRMVVDTAMQAALAVREEILTDLTRLHEVTLTAHALDSALYYVLRHSLRAVLETTQFAGDLHLAVVEERQAICSRIESMSSICNEQDLCLAKIRDQDYLLHSICTIFGVPPTSDVTTILKLAADADRDVRELKEMAGDEFRRREEGLRDFKKAQLPLINYLYDGCTKQPNCHDRGVAALTHLLTKEMDVTDNMVEEAKRLYVSVKTGDKQKLRKLWQWFVTDPARMVAVIKETQSKSYS